MGPDGARGGGLTRPPFLAWPGARHVAFTLGLQAIGFVWFYLVYGATDYLTGLHSWRVPVHLEAELAIPFVPAMTIAYSSLYPMFWCTPFALRTREEVWRFFRVYCTEVAIAGVFFLLIPATPAFPPHAEDELGPFAAMFGNADRFNLTYNMAPSLHVAFATTTAWLLTRNAAPGLRALFYAWAALICASTVLTHQHHLVDIAGGIVLTWFSVRRFAGDT